MTFATASSTQIENRMVVNDERSESEYFEKRAEILATWAERVGDQNSTPFVDHATGIVDRAFAEHESRQLLAIYAGF